MPSRAHLAGAWAAALIGCQAQAASPSAEPVAARDPASGLALAAVQIRSGTRVHMFTVEVARNRAEQARGLMHRKSLAPDAGMLFPFQPPRPAAHWMKDTFIPLDMIFVRSDGSIARIAANTVPHSLEQVGVAEPVAAVLEIPGGRAAELGINVGDRVTWTDRR